MKKKIIIILILIFIILVSILTAIVYLNDEVRFKLSYEYINLVEYSNGKKIKVNIPLNNNIKYIDENELLDILKNGTGIIYFGYNSCPWCRNAVPILIDTVKESSIDTIYYVDVHSVDISSIKDELISIIGSYLREDENNEKILSVPDVYFVKDGNIIGHHLGTVDSYNNPYSGMSDSEKLELSNIYKELIKEIE